MFVDAGRENGETVAPIAVACSTMVNASIGDSVKNGLIGNPDGLAIRVATLRRCLHCDAI